MLLSLFRCPPHPWADRLAGSPPPVAASSGSRSPTGAGELGNERVGAGVCNQPETAEVA